MSTRHLGVRAREHLNLADHHKNSAIKDHLTFCDVCCEACKAQLSADNFKILKKCRSDFDTEIQEALYIKKTHPKLNKQLYAHGASFLLNIF